MRRDGYFGKKEKTPEYIMDDCLSAYVNDEEVASLKEKRQRLLEEINSREIPEEAKNFDFVKAIREDRDR